MKNISGTLLRHTNQGNGNNYCLEHTRVLPFNIQEASPKTEFRDFARSIMGGEMGGGGGGGGGSGGVIHFREFQ